MNDTSAEQTPQEDQSPLYKKPKAGLDSFGGASSGGMLMNLALFIILLAFFIVLNAVTNYSKPKVQEAFDSLDTAFSTTTDFMATDIEATQVTDIENEEIGKDKGDSIEDVQGALKSILPGLDVDLTNNAAGRKVMAIRMEKDQFDRLKKRLLPVFYRILTLKDEKSQFDLNIVSYVSDTLKPRARYAYNTIEGYKNHLIDIDKKRQFGAPIETRMVLSLEKGNPAFLQFTFEDAVVHAVQGGL